MLLSSSLKTPAYRMILTLSHTSPCCLSFLSFIFYPLIFLRVAGYTPGDISNSIVSGLYSLIQRLLLMVVLTVHSCPSNNGRLCHVLGSPYDQNPFLAHDS